jgi:hypothetical protein
LIGGEGLSSRGHTGQGGEREEVATGGFQRTEPEGRAESYKLVIQGFPYTSMGLSLDSHGYPWVREGKVMDVHGSEKGKSQMHWETCVVQGRTTTQEFPGLSAVYNSLSGPFSLLREP